MVNLAWFDDVYQFIGLMPVEFTEMY